MAIKLTTTSLANDVVSTMVTNVNDHVDVSREMTGRWTGGTGTKALKMNNSSNLAGGNNSVCTGEVNSSSGTDSATIGGSGNTASAVRSVVIGGLINSAAGTNAGILAGNKNIANGTNGAIIGGDTNTVSASTTSSVILGGTQNQAKTNYVCIAGGTNVQVNPGQLDGMHSSNGTFHGGTLAFDSNTYFGTAKLVGGTVTIGTDGWISFSATPVFLTHQKVSGTPGVLYVDSASDSSNLIITSTSGSDTSWIGWMMVMDASLL